MPAAYPINSFQPIVPFDGPPTNESIGMLGQVGVDVNSGAYYQRIAGRWWPFGQGPSAPVLTTLTATTTKDNSPSDGATSNQIQIVTQDQNGDPMGILVNVTSSSTTSAQSSETNTNPSTGNTTLLVKDNVAETVTITVTDPTTNKTASATCTFV